MKNKDIPVKPITTSQGFPSHASNASNLGSDKFITGLTKREQAAIQIMANMASPKLHAGDYKHLARMAVAMADALFAELDKRGGE